ncbi:MAG: ATP synthase subunit delta [Bacteroidia bacterium]|nr:MAG: ATP synthase subunit delta [Bacteroidia bacterium]
MIAANRYAQAILDLAQQQNATEVIYNNAQSLFKIIKSNKDLYNFFKSPLIKSDKKEKIIRQLFEKSTHSILMQLISILCKRRREAIFPEILQAIIQEYKRRNNIVTAQLVTAFKFDDELRKNLIEKIKNWKKTDKIELQEVIDESIIGGFILKTENEQIDSSIKTQLNHLYQSFLQTNSLN